MVVWLRSAFVVVTAIAVAAADPPPSDSLTSRIFSLADGLIGRADNLELIDGVKIVKTSDAAPRSVSGDIGTMFLDRLDTYLRTHAVRLDLSGMDVRYGAENIGRAMSDFVEGRGKGNKDKKGKMKNMLLPLILAVKAKMAMLAAVMGNTIAMIAGKALIVSKIALILGFFLFLKKLVQDPPKEVQHQRIKHKKIYLPATDPDPGIMKDAADWARVKDQESWGTTNLDAHQMAYRRQMAVTMPGY